MDLKARLTDSFTVGEMVSSATAARLGIGNMPDERQLACLKTWCEKIGQPVRNHFGPVIITSGFRSPGLCLAIGSSATSWHAMGRAADFHCLNAHCWEVVEWINNYLAFDGMIYEAPPNSRPWVHCSYDGAKVKQRGKLQHYDGKAYMDIDPDALPDIGELVEGPRRGGL